MLQSMRSQRVSHDLVVDQQHLSFRIIKQFIWQTFKNSSWYQLHIGTCQEHLPVTNNNSHWHHWLDQREFEQASGVGDGQGSLVCCSPWGHKVAGGWAKWTKTRRAFAICLCCCSCWPLHSLKGIQGGEWGTLCPRETGETGLLDSYFQELISWSHFLHLLISRKTLNPFWWCQLLLLTSRKPFIKWVLDCTELPLHQNLIFRLSPLPLWSSFSDLSEGLSPGLQSKFCPK